MLVRVELESRLNGPAYDRAVEQVGERLRAVDAPRVVVGGEERARDEFQEQARKDLERGETLALPVMLVLLFLVFRGVVAAITPLLVAAVAVAGALLILLGVSHVADISAYSVNVITMLGLGLAVDYSLLVISRFREERAGGLELAAAIERTMATAGRTVAFSGLTVAASLCGLLAFAEPFLRSLAWGGIGVVLVALVAAVTLVPALLGLWGRRITPGRTTSSDHGAFYRLSRLVQRFAPVIVVAGRGPAGAAGPALPPRPAGELGPGVAPPLLGVPPAVRDDPGPLPGRRHRPGGGRGRVGPREPAGRRLPAPDRGAARGVEGRGPPGHPAPDHRARRHPRGHQRGAGGDQAWSSGSGPWSGRSRPGSPARPPSWSTTATRSPRGCRTPLG